MIRRKMITMPLTGGQGSRLSVLTQTVAKPAVPFGGKCRIINFPLNNCINSDVDIVGILIQYQPLCLNTHIGIRTPWNLDRAVGSVMSSAPYESVKDSDRYSSTANAIYQNAGCVDSHHPDCILIPSGDHIYKMDYEVMFDFRKTNRADLAVAVVPVPTEEASRFGAMITGKTNRTADFKEKPKKPKNNLASMSIYAFF